MNPTFSILNVPSADVFHDGVGDVGVHALDERHHGDDRGHRHDVAEHHHERPQLVGPDGAERELDGVEDLSHARSLNATGCRRRLQALADGRRPKSADYFLSFFSSGFTGSPSFRLRTELKGPVMTCSPGLQPREHLEVLVARDAGLDRHELGDAVADDEHALGFLPLSDRDGSSAAATVGSGVLARRFFSSRGGTHDLAVWIVDQLAHRHRLNGHR